MIGYVYPSLGVVLYENVTIVDINGCFSTSEYCGCGNDTDTVMIGWYRDNITDGESWENDDRPYYLTKMKCGKPVNMIIDGCEVVDIKYSWDFAGSVYCPDNYFMKGINSEGHDGYIFQWEKMLCCNFTSIDNREYTVRSAVNNNWEICLDYEGWCNISDNTFMNGMYRPNYSWMLHDISRAYSQSIVWITNNPTNNPSIYPTETPSNITPQPSTVTDNPTNNPSIYPTVNPSLNPTEMPSDITSQPSIVTQNPTMRINTTTNIFTNIFNIPSPPPTPSPVSNAKISKSKIPATILQIIIIITIILVIILATVFCCLYKRLQKVKNNINSIKTYVSSNNTDIIGKSPSMNPTTQNNHEIPGETKLSSNNSEELYEQASLHTFQSVVTTPGNISTNISEGNAEIPTTKGFDSELNYMDKNRGIVTTKGIDLGRTSQEDMSTQY